MKAAWRKELLFAVALFAAAVVLGWFIDHLPVTLLVVVVAYLSWHLVNALFLYLQLSGSTRMLPAWGLWRDIHRELSRLEQTRRDFVGNASHELRTPLTVLRGYLDMIHEDAASGNDTFKDWRQPLDDMLQQSTRMENIVGDMLALARLESESANAGMEPVDVPDMLKNIASQAKALSGGQHTIHLDAKPKLHLHGEANELQSIFSNLVMNAIKHTPAGSEIVVRWKLSGQSARFSVSDNGPGIPTADIPRLAERFYRVDVGRSRASGGTGLGLAIVKHALERHDSALVIESRHGNGATFHCSFPPRRSIIGNPSRS